MQRITLSFFIVLAASAICFGQHTQTTKNTVDQTLRSSGRVNPSTLGMEFDLPLGSYKGRGFDLPLGLSYSSKVWKLEEDQYDANSAITRVDGIYSEDSAAGWTSSLAQPHIEYTGMTRLFDTHGRPYNWRNASPTYYHVYYVRRLTVFLPGGESHELRASDVPVPMPSPLPNPLWPPASAWEGIFVATDGSGLKYEQDTNANIFRLYLSDGSFYDFNSGPPEPHGLTVTQSYIRRARRLTDVNGNFAEFNAANGTYKYGSWTDQLGRTFPVMVPPETPWGFEEMTEFTDTFFLPGMGNNSYELKWQRLASVFAETNYATRYIGKGFNAPFPQNPLFVNENIFATCGYGDRPQFPTNSLLAVSAFNYFHSTGDPPFNPMVLAEVKLPNGAKYRFKYNEYGEIEKIEYPFGGYEEFDYKKVDSLAGQAEGVQQANRGVENRRVYESTASNPITYSYSSASSDHNYRTSVTAPDGTQTDTFMHRGIRPLCDAQTEYEYYYNGLKWGYDTPLAGRVWETRVFSNDQPKQIKQRTITRWITTTATPSVYIRAQGPRLLEWNARVDTTQNITYEGNSGVSTATKLAYDSADERGSPLNVTKRSEYAYETVSDGGSYSPAETATWPPTSTPTLDDPTTGDTPVRVRWMTYETGTAYTNRNILRLPTEVLVTDGASTPNVKAKSQIGYDESTYLVSDTPTGTVPGWGTPEPSASPYVRGLATTTKAWPDLSGNPIQTHTQYDQFGNVRKTWDGNGNLSQIEYADRYSDSTNRHTYAFPTKTISPVPGGNGSTSSFETQTTYEFETGLPTKVVDPNGGETEMLYVDPMRRPTKVIAPNDAETITEYGEPSDGTYPAGERFVKVKSQVDSANWKEAYTWFDGLGRTDKTQAVDDDGDVFVLTCYDNMSRVSKASNPFRGLTDQNCSTANGTSDIFWTTNTFDTAGRPWKITTPDGAVVETTYSVATSGGQIGTVVTVEDQADKQRRSITNALGQLIRVDEPTTSGTALGNIYSPNQATLYTYNTLGQMIRVQQGIQNRYFKYDTVGRMLRVKQPEQEVNTGLNTSGNPNNNAWSAGFTYDSNGNVLTTTDAKGTTITNTYDALNRATSRTYNDNPQTPTVTFSYDGVGVSPTPDFSKGKLTKVSSSVSESKYVEFDVAGRLKQFQQITDAQTYTSKYTYNLSGMLIEEEYPSGRKVKSEFDQSGDLSKVMSQKNSSGVFIPYANNFSYSAAGAITSMRLGNGKWETASFNSRLQPVQLGLGASATDYGLWKVNYEFGELQTNGSVDVAKNNGNIGKQTLTVPGTYFVQGYKYDSQNRVTEAKETTSSTQNWIQQFGYDVYGNRTSFSQTIGSTTINTTPSIDAGTNRFSGSQGFAYDKNGSITQDVDPLNSHTRSFTFNGDNKQTEVKDVTASNHVVGKYFYDGEGKRIKKVTDTETTIFVYSAGKLVAEYSTEVVPIEDAKVSYVTTDHLASPRVLTGQNTDMISRRDFMPFGEELAVNVGGRTAGLGYGSADDSIRQKFTGYQRDSESSLDFAEARMYENRFGRFTAIDPLLASGKSADPQTFNRFIYVRNNPLILVDPTGQITGDYYTRDLNYIGSDGKNDGKYYYAEVDYRNIVPEGDGHVEIIHVKNKEEFTVPSAENQAIRALATGVSNGVDDGVTGIGKGIGNAPAVGLNGVTSGLFNSGIQGAYFQGSNPLEVPLPFAFNNAREASYGSAGSTGTLVGLGVAGGAIFGGSSAASVVPEGQIFAPIKAGSVGGPTAGQRFPESVRQQAFAENNLCVFCRGVGTEIDHAVAASRGGNATIQNAQVTCRFCNASKGSGRVPKNPAPGYEGPFPPSWWWR